MFDVLVAEGQFMTGVDTMKHAVSLIARQAVDVNADDESLTLHHAQTLSTYK